MENTKRLFSTFSLSLALSLFFQLPSAWAEKKGPGSTGGGNAVFLESGELRLIDTLTREELQSIKTSAWRAVQKIQSSAPFQFEVRSLRDKNFFSCALKKINNSRLFSLALKDYWNDILGAVSVSRVTIPNLETFGYTNTEVSVGLAIYHATYGKLPLLPFAYSTKLSHHNQIPVAAYRWMQIDIYDDFYSKLPESDQCATQIHEAIRVLGDTISESPFTTDQVEALTQAVMELPILNEQAYLSAQKTLKERD